jgi:hypothetical protein
VANVPGINVSFPTDKLLEEFGAAPSELIDALLGQAEATFTRIIQGNTPYDPTAEDKSSGDHIKASWASEIDKQGQSLTIGTDFVYAPVLDFGGYPGVGPRTVAGSGGIFSRQAPAGIIQPILKDASVLDKALEMIAAKLPKKFGHLNVTAK